MFGLAQCEYVEEGEGGQHVFLFLREVAEDFFLKEGIEASCFVQGKVACREAVQVAQVVKAA